ncbi:MAG: B3/4 domain-containing protein [Anaerovoracaceae bacterium]|jgi:DNA/RNA-binding domain of Phe-tRNA-synthetase-like protein
MGASSDEAAVERVLLKGWENAAKAASAYGNPQSHPNIIPWVERMKAMGAPRKKFPSSIEAMVRRAGKGGQPFRISPVVDFYNGISMKNIVPAGGFDLGQLESDLLLRLSLEGDTFVALDSQEETPVSPGEVSYADGSKIITRHFVWKQAKHALLTEESNHILFVSEILGEIPDAVLSSVRDDLIEGLRECFGITAECRIVDENNPYIDITV